MIRRVLRVCGKLQKPVGFHTVRGPDPGHAEVALGQGPCLVKDHRAAVGKRFHVVGAFYEDTLARRVADATEEGQGHRDNRCAGAGDS